ncbi:oligosaccharide flippase family protein, partial [Salmonella enterica]|uniref:oligosaccharide flippase family protein n=1 Tax=Salmonella enterica TaxID=28901 RepID=UPI0032B58938
VWIALAIHELGFRKRHLWPEFKLFDKETARELLALGWKLLLSQTARTALRAVDAMVLGMVFGAESIAAFSLAARLFFMAQVSQYAMN